MEGNCHAKSSTFAIVDQLVQGGLEIPIGVTVDSNAQVLKKYEELVFKQPVNGTFDDVTDLVLEALMSDENDNSDTES